jgi:glycosyltransferase 2 family protein
VIPPATAAEPKAEPASVPSEPDDAGEGRFARQVAGLSRLMRSKVIRFGFLSVVLVVLVVALVGQAGTLWTEIQKLSAPVLLVAFIANLSGLVCSMMVWRTLLADLGSRLSVPVAWRVMFIGQLAKYIPGSIWPVITQTELGADRGVPRSRSAVSVLLAYGVMTGSGGLVAAVTLPFVARGSFDRYFWVLFILPVGAAVLSPPVLNRAFALLLRLLRRTPLEQGVSIGGLSLTMGWALASWTCNGFMTYVLMLQLAGHRHGTFIVSVGAYALSWVIGFLAVFAPAGAGVREAVMVAILSTRTTASVALTVALVTRALAVLSDSAAGFVAAGLIGRRRLQQLRATRRVGNAPRA